MRVGSEPYVLTFGETLGLISTAGPGSLAHASALTLGVGGAESNVAIGLCRLGTAAVWVGRVGHDSIGERVLREIRAEDVDVRATVDPHRPTALMLKENAAADVTRVWYYRAGSAGSQLCAQDLAAELITGAALLHVTGITPSLSAPAAAATRHAITTARSAGVPVSFDINHRPALWRGRDPRDLYTELAAHATIVFAGADEARLVAPEASTVAGLAAHFAALGPEQVVIKLGADGCLALVDGVEYRQEAIPIRALDTVGAGDAFAAGYLAEQVAGQPVRRRLITATTAGAFACLGRGDWESLPRRSELAALTRIDPVVR